LTAYHTLADMHQYGIDPVACGRVSTPDQEAIVAARNAWADSKLRGRYNLPLIAWDVDLRMNLSFMSAWDVISRRGYNPAAPGDVTIRLRYDDAVKWFDGVERGNTHPNVTETTPSVPTMQAPMVITSPKRGW